MPSNTDVEAGKSGLLSKKTKEKEPEPFGFKNDVSFIDSKLGRLLSVILYVSLVSGIGFLFAMYHFFFWDSTMPPVAKVHGHEVY